jgi:hypothetical protein
MPESFEDCRFCHGRGCLVCPTEAIRVYKELCPDDQEPELRVSYNELQRSEIRKILREAFNSDAVEQGFDERGLTGQELIQRVFAKRSANLLHLKIRLARAKIEIDTWRSKMYPTSEPDK